MTAVDATDTDLPAGAETDFGVTVMDERPAWKPLRLLTFYRLILAGLLTVLYLTISGETTLGMMAPGLYGLTCIVYLLFGLLAGFAARLRWPGYEVQAISQLFVDIGVITVLIHASGGLASGLGILLIITVATGSILFPGRMAFMFAAVATLAVMGEHFYNHLLQAVPNTSGYTQVGLVGIALFASAGVTDLLARRIRESETLARRRAVDIANLARLNAHIVQRLQAGIVVTDHLHNILLINDTARKLLHTPGTRTGQPLARLSPALFGKLMEWQRAPASQPTLLRDEAHASSILPQFTRLDSSSGPGALIFLEDMAAMEKQAQQIKLASLGRLTASIAHEIRNPLGAISHAAQLLNEQNVLAAEDRRLTTIIGDNTSRVNLIVENILQLSRPNSSIPRVLQLADWLKNFAEEFMSSGNCTREQISCSAIPADIEICMDPSLLHQVVWNLCQNAIHHGRATPTIRLQLIASLTATPGVAHLDIIDNGPGIEPDMTDKIFEPFFTTHSSGTGLGLYIAREICESNGAHLEYRPLAEGGSCFRITFPVSTESPANRLAAQSAS
ncbi:MAG TPA: ATP-binding protein [Gammaproteobacteria bacterium]|nr:ATP-binding protein [Gammaproteobacteria bacterium]